MMRKCKSMAAVVVLALTGSAGADIDICQDGCGEGSDGALIVGENQVVTINLAAAVPGNWDDPSPQEGSGIFDENKWAVVFKYTIVNVQSGGKIEFLNHPSGAPVVWLVSGDVRIEGTVDLSGERGSARGENRSFARPGPGGFRGGRASAASSSGSAGFGPGGAGLGDACSFGSGGSHATSGGRGSNGGGTPGPIYGNPLILPLIGGSGAAPGNCPENNDSAGGGAGGGAILIACNTTIAINGIIAAGGGSGSFAVSNSSGGGAGGAVRLIAETVVGAGSIAAPGGAAPVLAGDGGSGRNRIQANRITLDSSPDATHGFPGDPIKLWPSAMAPIIRVVSLDGHDIAATPKRGLNFPDQEVFMNEPGEVALVIQAFNVPPSATMRVRLVRKSGLDTEHPAVLIDEQNGLWQAQVVVASEISAIQVRAVLP